HGEAQLVVDPESQGAFSGRILGEITPKNFGGESYHFAKDVDQESGIGKEHLGFPMPNPRLWWPVDLGDPNLYTLKLWLVTNDAVVDVRAVDFGIRSVVMAPLPEGPGEDQYNWTFIVNGEPHFMTGTNWCTLDPLMDFSRERFHRFLSLAAQ